MGNRLLVDEIIYIKIEDIYANLNDKPIKFNFENLRKCRPSILPSIIYSEEELMKKINDWKINIKDEYKNNNKMNILDPNEFTHEIKLFDTTILSDYVHHLYNPDDIYVKWNVPRNLIDDFKKYIGAIIYKLFSSNDNLFIEGHLNSLSTAICYCPERHKNEMIFLYELLINENENNFKQLQFNEFKIEHGSNEHIENIKLFIEDNIKKFIGKSKMKILMYIFGNPENTQNVHLFNYWKYVLSDHIGLDIFGNKPTLIGKDKFNGRIELGLQAFFEKFTPEWLVIELKNYINSDNDLMCKIAEFLYFSDIQDKLLFVECEDNDILFTKSVTIEFCEYILKSMEIIIVNIK
ncbi:hypothetical protein NAPIS_ORF00566 [Vairimorpha apis BRL 01]|uniref:Uncharacterized protein n=1 Tax=Vairimorpha apis BRL 01 TaxID=1037528 RepID=T0MFL0_9MICR|nr:hypothetical protein NAPIS_ORF00566 [Vairimorpha apis BRL 01]